MAIVNITVDTEAKTITANVNGEEATNIDSVYVYRTTEYEYGEDPEKVVRVQISGGEKTDDVRKNWMICASKVDVQESNSVKNDFLACRTSN